MAGDEPLVVPVVCGPTGAGKSALAEWLAARTPVTIVVADSRQVYRGFDAGTAKPGRRERDAIPHRGIDLVDPSCRYSAALWADQAHAWIAEAEHAGRVPLVVGGTGLYLRALFAPFFDEPPLDAHRRRALARVLAPMSLSELARWTHALDPARAHLGRAQLLRAIEIALLTGNRLSSLHRVANRPARRAPRYLVVDPGPALAGQIANRLDAMLAGGWVEEVRRLSREHPEDAPAWKSTGYRAVRALARGELSAGAARERILVETRQYAKRQRTWFRHQLPRALVTTLDPSVPGWQRHADQWWESVLTARHTQ